MTTDELAPILAAVRRIAYARRGKWPCEYDELVSVGYCAVAEGIATHDSARGSLESRCTYLAWKRMTDYMRIEWSRPFAALRETGGYSRDIAYVEAAHDLGRIMRACLTPHRQRVVAGRLAGKAFAEISVELGISTVASKVSYHEAMNAMKESNAAIRTH